MNDDVNDGDDVDELVYELEEWDDDLRGRLGDALQRAGIPFRWEDGTDLIVDAGDEERVDDLLDEVEFPDALEPVDDDGDDEASYDVMSDLFLVADRVAEADMISVELAGDFVEAAQAAAGASTPFGIDDGTWNRILGLAASIAEALEQEADDEGIIRDAQALRSLLRQFV